METRTKEELVGTRTKEGTVRGDTNQRGAVAKNISENFGIRTPLNINLTVRGDTNQRGAVAKNISGNFGIRTPLNIILTVRGDTNQR